MLRTVYELRLTHCLDIGTEHPFVSFLKGTQVDKCNLEITETVNVNPSQTLQGHGVINFIESSEVDFMGEREFHYGIK